MFSIISFFISAVLLGGGLILVRRLEAAKISKVAPRGERVTFTDLAVTQGSLEQLQNFWIEELQRGPQQVLVKPPLHSFWTNKSHFLLAHGIDRDLDKSWNIDPRVKKPTAISAPQPRARPRTKARMH